MTGYLLLTTAILFQMVYAFCRFKEVENYRNYKRIAYITALTAVTILLITNVLQWDFTCYILYFYLLIRSIIGLLKMKLGKDQNKKPGKGRIIISTMGACIFSLFLLFPMILFPDYEDIAVTGSYEVETASYTYTDSSRTESYEDNQTDRKVTAQFWYPAQDESRETYPLVIFSHGAFGYRMSNYSTFMELASNGYVVCSIDHSYHAFYTDHTDGTSVIADFEFLNNVMQTSDFEEEKIHELSKEWLELRTGDMQFILDTIIKQVTEGADDPLFSSIDTDKIGLSGHSLGGAAAAQTGQK